MDSSANPIRVGMIGASARRGWAKESHVPAVDQLGGLELYAVAATNQDSADAAAEAFGAARAYGEAEAMFEDPAVDLVTIAVKVPAHAPLLRGAIAAGKHVFCEWPLGRDSAESEELRDATQEAGVHAAIGLQARQSPAVRRARELVAGGALGRVLSARGRDCTIAFAPVVEAADLYLNDPGNGATLVSIHAGHSLDLAIAVLGELADVNALGTTQYPTVEVEGDPDSRRQRTIPDHLLCESRLADGGALGFEVVGGRPADDTPFELEVVGTDATLAILGGAPRGFQSGRLRLERDGRPEEVDEGELSDLPDTAAYVGSVYAALRDAIRGSGPAPADFDHALRLSRLIDAVCASAAAGRRHEAGDWPAALPGT